MKFNQFYGGDVICLSAEDQEDNEVLKRMYEKLKDDFAALPELKLINKTGLNGFNKYYELSVWT